MKTNRIAALGWAACLAAACSEGRPADPEEALIWQGRAAYQTDCVACHNPDPTKPGALAPEIAGSPLALLEAKVLRNEYPPGYTPKRDTQAMIALVHREPDLPALEAYLASFPR
ncbi:MAG: c-type cytochrome [Myxococcota bacterium]